MKIPLLDLAAIHTPLRSEILAAVERVIDSQSFVLGADVAALEREIEAYCGLPEGRAIACASGSDALLLALMALDLQPGETVLTSPFSFFATAGSISNAGGVPAFSDIDPLTFNLDADKLIEQARRTPRLRAIIVVHLYGGCADMDPILEFALPRGIAVIEDAAQAIGAGYRDRPAMSLGDFGCLSFFPSKNLGAFGDAGLVSARTPEAAAKLRALRVHGSERRYFHEWVGVNSRLDTLQAAILRVKLRHLDEWTAQRQAHAALYRKLVGGLGLPIATPEPAVYQTRHVYNQYVIRCPRRDALREFLAARGIGSEIYYPCPIHLQQCYADLGHRPGDFPEAERAAAEVLALPVHPGLSETSIEAIAGAVADFHRG